MSYPEHIQRYIKLVRAAEKACEEADLYAWRNLEGWEREEWGYNLTQQAWDKLQMQLDLFKAIADKESN